MNRAKIIGALTVLAIPAATVLSLAWVCGAFNPPNTYALCKMPDGSAREFPDQKLSHKSRVEIDFLTIKVLRPDNSVAIQSDLMNGETCYLERDLP
jgi:hypothetical protein